MSTASVTSVAITQNTFREEWHVEVSRTPSYRTHAAPPCDLPDDVRQALLKWLGA